MQIDEIETTLISYVGELTGRIPARSESILDTGINSLKIAFLLDAVRTKFGVSLSLSSLFENPSIEKLALEIRAERNGTGASEVESRPLCVLVLAGGMTFAGYSHLTAAFQENGFEVAVLRADAEMGGLIEQIARGFLPQIESRVSGNRWIIGGWSSGGVIAFEIAQALRGSSNEPDQLVLIDSYRIRPDVEAHEESRGGIASFLRTRIGASAEKDISGETSGEMVESARESGLVRAEAWDGAVDLLVSDYIVHKQALSKYRPEFYEGRSVCFQADNSPISSHFEHMSAFCSLSPEVRRVRGGHYDAINAENSAAIASEAVSEWRKGAPNFRPKEMV